MKYASCAQRAVRFGAAHIRAMLNIAIIMREKFTCFMNCKRIFCLGTRLYGQINYAHFHFAYPLQWCGMLVPALQAIIFWQLTPCSNNKFLNNEMKIKSFCYETPPDDPAHYSSISVSLKCWNSPNEYKSISFKTSFHCRRNFKPLSCFISIFRYFTCVK